ETGPPGAKPRGLTARGSMASAGPRRGQPGRSADRTTRPAALGPLPLLAPDLGLTVPNGLLGLSSGIGEVPGCVAARISNELGGRDHVWIDEVVPVRFGVRASSGDRRPVQPLLRRGSWPAASG